MTTLTVKHAELLRGEVHVPGDKSISHRAILLGAMADGESHIRGFLPSGDCLATVGCVRSLGINVTRTEDKSVIVGGKGLTGLQSPEEPLNCVRSGTTMRLLTGILAGQRFDSVLTGETQLLHRPMRRITEPLSLMGASIAHHNGCAPLEITGQPLKGTDHHLKIASAQVKSAILLAGLFAEGQTTVHQPGPARDHTERMLAAQIVTRVPGIQVLRYDREKVSLDPEGIKHLAPFNVQIPGDISSAAFIIAAALLIPGSEMTVKGVGINPTRTGLLDVLSAMGADIRWHEREEQGGEPVADITIRYSKLEGTEISGGTVVRMIDEFPILAVIATQAHGTTVVRDAAELRVKETDRIATVVDALQAMGARIQARPDGFIIEGPALLHGQTLSSRHDHRLGMALAIAGLVATGETAVKESECIADSFPGFEGVLQHLGADVTCTLD
ncbi:MAG: 3-phosphoshikimate 1-carboxyvinyltransferase [Anaerolineae bacterium]|nr:3-phosphoshikimate 1-carboxyvinyltransferase [Anaerolineae bacterium]